jgi:hypothetical protein
VGDEVAVRLEGPRRVVREVTRRSGQATEDDRRPHHRLLPDHPDERRRHPNELLGAFASFELAVTARQLDRDVLGADGGRLLGVVQLERCHEGLCGRERIRHSRDY